MKGYQLLRRIDLLDDYGDVLSVIVETNTVSWKLFCIYKKPGQTDQQGDHSTWWNFVNQDRALEHQDTKVAEAVADGWHRSQ